MSYSLTCDTHTDTHVVTLQVVNYEVVIVFCKGVFSDDQQVFEWREQQRTPR